MSAKATVSLAVWFKFLKPFAIQPLHQLRLQRQCQLHSRCLRLVCYRLNLVECVRWLRQVPLSIMALSVTMPTLTPTPILMHVMWRDMLTLIFLLRHQWLTTELHLVA
jgi:hypothetical protein